MKHIIILFLLLTLSLSSFSQVSLTGRITDKKNGQTIPGANIYLPDLKSIAVSDTNGYYKIDNLPARKVLMQVTMFGYKPIVLVVDLSKTTVENFVLESSVKELNEVVVTGTSEASEIRRDPIPIAVISATEIQQSNSTNIIEALNTIPGLSTLTTGPNVSKPYIHGLGYNRVLTLYDGMRQEEQQWGDEHGVEIDQFLIDHIEVIKGPASLMYGSDALAGVINLIPANPVPDGAINGSFLADYMTNNKQIAGSLNLDGNYKGLTWGFRASHKQAGDYEDPIDGRVFQTKYDENDINAYFGVHKAWGYSKLNFSLWDDLQEIPDGSRDSLTRQFTEQITNNGLTQIVSNSELNNYKIATLHQHVQHYRVMSTNNFVIGQSTLAFNLGLEQSIHREYDWPQNPDIPGLYIILNTLTYDVKYHLPEVKGFEPSFGINGMLQQNTNPSGATEFVIPSYNSFDFGPFAYAKKTLGRWDISGGLRFDMRLFNNSSMYIKPNPANGLDMQTSYNPQDPSVQQQFQSYDHTFSGETGSLGATYNVSDNVGFKFNIARGYRAPNAAEISAKGVHPGTGFEQLGDDNLKSELSLQEDAGMFVNTPHVTLSLDVFNNIIDNYIYNEKLLNSKGTSDSLFHQNNGVFPVYKFQQTTAEIYGGEIDIDLHPHPLDWLHFENSLSYLNGLNLGGNGITINSEDKYLPLIMPLHTNTELRAETKKKFKHFSSFFIKFGFKAYATQDHFFAANGTETRTPGYALFDAGIGGNVLDNKGNTLFSINIIGTNLANRAYQSNMDRLKYFEEYTASPNGHLGIYEMGRNISFTVTVPIDIRK